MLELDAIDKRFGRRGPDVLADVSLRAAPGAVTVVQGRSGGGKTTLLRIVAGLERASAGSVRLDGSDLSGRPPEQRDVGLAFQSLVVYPHLSAAGNVRMAAEAGGLRGARRREAVDAALIATGLTDLADRRPAAMSGGQLQRLALARMLARRPRVCLLDEPLAHLDPPARLALRELVGRLRDEARIVVLVTHDGAEAMRLADHLAILAPPGAGGAGAASGETGATILAAGPPAELAAHPRAVAVADATGVEPVNLFPASPGDAFVDGGVARPPGGVHLAVRPEAIAWAAADGEPAEDATPPGRQSIIGRVTASHPVPGGTEIVLDTPGLRPFRIRTTDAGVSRPPAAPSAGDRLRASWPVEASFWFDGRGRRVGGPRPSGPPQPS
jgi:ABC-type sugar transport system ATPase subunit